MEIVDRFRAFITANNLFHPNDRVLLAVSGGRDSMLMLWLFHTAGIRIEVAHCNFSLRDEESDGDEQLVSEYCASLDIPLHVKRFETETFAKDNKLSIQMAARELRYTWFDQLANELSCDAIAIAQHKNDHVETVLLNLTRGTGLAGLQGILPQRGHIIRPLLFLDTKEITATVTQLKIPYRDDSSNFSNKYARNKIRLDIIPRFEELAPGFVETMEDNIGRFQDAYRVLQVLISELRQKLLIKTDKNEWEIEKSVWQSYDLPTLYYLFEPFGFTKSVLQDVQSSPERESGRIFESTSHQLLLDRNKTILQKKSFSPTSPVLVTKDSTEIHWQDNIFQITVSEDTTILKNPSIAQLDWDKLTFPLRVRNWQEGDYFQPLGMPGKKKLSDFFINQKISLFEKRNIPIWINGNNDIIWISGRQIDDRYKITENTQKVLTLVCQKQRI